MRRFSRLSAIIISCVMLIGTVSGVVAAQDTDVKTPSTLRECIQMCD